MKLLAYGLSMIAMATAAFAAEPNYDESKIPSYTLPDPLVHAGGTPVTAESWPGRREEILELFRDHVYGRAPGRPERFELVEVERGSVFGRKGIRRQLRLTLEHRGRSLAIDLLVHQPAHADGPVPSFLGLNFDGNQVTTDDPAVPLTRAWVRSRREYRNSDNLAVEASRGTKSHRWPAEMLVTRGYALVTACYGDIDPDFDDGFANGVHELFDEKSPRSPNAWGSIAAWAWGLSRILDAMETDDAFDPGRVAVIGHSRLGKTALWAGATDERFAMVVSNNSGCGGAALSRRRIGETVEAINDRFPHWFAKSFHRYNDNENALPVDQHMLIAAIAPRPVYVASAGEDRWADPKGEFLALKAAEPVWKLLGKRGLPCDTRPAPGERLISDIAYHLREGKHEVMPWDWQGYLEMAEGE